MMTNEKNFTNITKSNETNYGFVRHVKRMTMLFPVYEANHRMTYYSTRKKVMWNCPAAHKDTKDGVKNVNSFYKHVFFSLLIFNKLKIRRKKRETRLCGHDLIKLNDFYLPWNDKQKFQIKYQSFNRSSNKITEEKKTISF